MNNFYYYCMGRSIYCCQTIVEQPFRDEYNIGSGYVC